MIGIFRGILFAGAMLAAAGAIPARSQENLDAGKTPAQLYAADCAICHKTPDGMSKAGGVFGLSGFLREHYTASREAANAIAAYVQSVDKGPPPDKKRTKRAAKRDEKGKPSETKKDESKAREEKSKPEPKAQVAPKIEEKAGEAKPATEKATGAKTDIKSEAPKAEDKPAAKDASPEKKPD